MGTNLTPSLLAAALFGRTRRGVLGCLFTHPDESFYVREIARAVGTGHGAVQRELTNLSKAGILRRQVDGRQVYFQANPETPIFVELKAIAIKTVGVGDALSRALAPLAERLDVAFVFGSFARGEPDFRSDVDVFIVGRATFASVSSALAPSESELGRAINPVVMAREEFQARLTDGERFVTTVVSEPKVLIVGSADELERLVGEGVADSL